MNHSDKISMQTIVEMTFGSYLYGTQTPALDLDIKAIYIPNARGYLLQRIQPVVSYKRPKMQGEKNTSEDIDNEAYSIAKFLELLAEGQTVALDMLFAPQQAMREKPIRFGMTYKFGSKIIYQTSRFFCALL